MNKTILISGITGFIGSHASSYFRQSGYRVVGFSRNASNADGAFKGDITDKHFVNALFEKYAPGVYIHASGENTKKQGMKTSMEGILNVLEACRGLYVKRIIFVSTSQVYKPSSATLSENSPITGFGPYERMKVASERTATRIAKKYQLPMVVIRFVNIFGPGDGHGVRIVPAIIRGVLKKNAVILWGNGLITRQFLFIDDALNAMSKIITYPFKSGVLPQIFNIGPERAVDIRQLADIIRIKAGSKNKVVFTNTIKRKVPERVLVSSLKAKNILHWEPHYTLEAGLQKTIDWYKNNFST